MKPMRSLAQTLGYELIKERKSPTLRAHLKNVFDRYRIDVVLDVGANLGQFATMIRQGGYRGHIYSFEPVTASFDRLSAAARDDGRWQVFKRGLGDRQARMAINLSESSDLNSLLAANDYGRARYPKIAAATQEMIEIDTLEHFFAEQGIPDDARIFLKMDTQGYDLKVFEGAGNALGRIAVLLSELSLMPIYDGAPHWLEVLARYEHGGFRVSGLYPVSRNADLTVIEADCVLVRRPER